MNSVGPGSNKDAGAPTFLKPYLAKHELSGDGTAMNMRLERRQCPSQGSLGVKNSAISGGRNCGVDPSGGTSQYGRKTHRACIYVFVLYWR